MDKNKKNSLRNLGKATGEENMTQNKKEKQSNIKDHSENQFESIVTKGLIEGGIHLNAMKNFGKSRLLFCMAQQLKNSDNVRVLIFDGSEAWLYGFSKIPVFTIGEHDIQLISDVQKTDDIERYEFTNWQLVKLALATEKDILFRLETRKPSKRGFAIRQIILHLDALQRQQRKTTANHEPKQRIAYFIEESQDAFNIRSTMKLEAEEFLTAFNESRNNFEAYYSCNQRETDTAKTLRVKQLMAYGKIPECDKSAYHRRLEKLYNVNFSKLPQRTWFFEGATFVSPTWKQSGKPYQINRELRAKFMHPQQQPQKKLNIFQKLIFGINTLLNPIANLPKPTQRATNRNFGNSESSNNDSEDWNNPDSEDIDSESEIEIDESEEYPEEWGI